jgi:23S rRNA pseudouridine1911/1915/1917 synthase
MKQSNNEAKNFIVPPNTPSARLDVWLAQMLPAFSRSYLAKLIKSGLILLNGKPSQGKMLVAPGDRVAVYPAPQRTNIAATSSLVVAPIAVLYEDDDLLVINKPAGISVHPGAGDGAKATVVDWLLQHCPQLAADASGFPDASRPGVVHRLDKDTSGSLLLAKSPAIHGELAGQFRIKSNRREYLALLDGVPPWQQLSYASYLARHPNQRLKITSYSQEEGEEILAADPGRRLRFAQSHFAVEAIYAHRLALARVTLATGRTHQIRVQSKALGFPLWGDPQYHSPHRLPQVFAPEVRRLLEGIKRQMLHAERLHFVHPRTKEEHDIRAPLPKDFAAVVQALAPYKV